MKPHFYLLLAFLGAALHLPIAAQPTCMQVNFDDIGAGASFVPGDIFSSEGLDAEVSEFFLDPGPCAGTTTSGNANIVPDLFACGSNDEINLNNVNVTWTWPDSVAKVTLRYGYGAGVVNLSINGDCLAIDGSYTAYDGINLGGVDIDVIAASSNDLCGILVFTGNIAQLGIGGQQAAIDDLTFCDNCPDALTADLGDLTFGDMYNVGEVAVSGDASLSFTEFYQAIGSCSNPATDGNATVQSDGQACGSGNELWINNINAEIDFGGDLSYIVVSFSDFGGNVNLSINGDCYSEGMLTDVPAVVGGVDVWVVDYDPLIGGCAKFYASGVISQFSIGGQEFVIDDICACLACGDVLCNAENSGPICTGEDLNLIEDGGEAVSWSWTSSDPTTVIMNANTANATALTPSNGEVFTVEITDANGCMSSCSTTAIVNELPLCNATNGGPICAGDDLPLEENAGEAVSWSWTSSNPATTILNADTATPTAVSPENGEVFTVVITDNNGCSSSCSTTAAVNDLPICMAMNNGPICVGEELLIRENGGEAISWSWTTDGPSTILSPNSDISTVSGAIDGETFTVEITDANGCTSTCSTTVEVFPDPVADPSSNSPICIGDILSLKANASGGTAPYTYQWEGPDGFTSMQANPYVWETTAASAGTYTVEVTDANGCMTIGAVDVTLAPNLTDPGEIEGDEYFCGPGYDASPITQVSAPSGAPGVIEYFWMKNVEGVGYWEVIPGATGPTYDPGILYVTTSYSRCVRIDGCIRALESNIVTKTVGNEADATLSGPGAACLNNIVTYSVPMQLGASYEWHFGYGATPETANTASVDVSWNSFGLRTVTVTVTTPTCVGYNQQQVYVTTSSIYCMMMAPLGSGLQVFPNPFQDAVQLQLAAAPAEKTAYRILNVQGQVVHTGWWPEGAERLDVQLDELPEGVYIVTVQLGEKELIQRLIKQ